MRISDENDSHANSLHIGKAPEKSQIRVMSMRHAKTHTTHYVCEIRL